MKDCVTAMQLTRSRNGYVRDGHYHCQDCGEPVREGEQCEQCGLRSEERKYWGPKYRHNHKGHFYE